MRTIAVAAWRSPYAALTQTVTTRSSPQLQLVFDQPTPGDLVSVSRPYKAKCSTWAAKRTLISRARGDQRVQPGEVEFALDWLDLLPRHGDFEGVGMDRLDGRPDLRKHVWVVARIVRLPAEDQIRCAVDEQRVPSVLGDKAREFRKRCPN